MECLNEDVQKKKKKMMISVQRSRAFLIATRATLLDTNYEFYRFNGDLIEIIN